MSYAHSRQLRRQDASSFDSKMYYTLNNLVLPNYTLSAGATGGGAEALINVTTSGITSSENWQLFYQSGKYFIRNFDYGAKWQLGLIDGDKSAPKMYPRSGSLSQQWTLKQVTGGWEIRNELVSGEKLGMPAGWSIPAMRTENDGAVWNITSNPSAVKVRPLQDEIISPVAGFISATPTPSPTQTSASPSSASPTDARLTGLPTLSSALPSASASSAPASSTPSSSALSSGAIAGIAIGAIALLGVAIFALWFFLFRKKRAPANHGAPYEVHADPVVSEKYAYHQAAELSTPPAEMMSQDYETINGRAELSGTYGGVGENRGGRM